MAIRPYRTGELLFALGDDGAILRYSLPLMNFPSILRHSLRISCMRCISIKGRMAIRPYVRANCYSPLVMNAPPFDIPSFDDGAIIAPQKKDAFKCVLFFSIIRPSANNRLHNYHNNHNGCDNNRIYIRTARRLPYHSARLPTD